MYSYIFYVTEILKGPSMLHSYVTKLIVFIQFFCFGNFMQWKIFL